MYTQCPDCETAFRVTARVLQQAAGRVRCGRCGCLFSALERLSEDPPERTAHASRGDSTALLETLDELSGSGDVRIEDTGIEWRVVDEDMDDPEVDVDAVADDSDEGDDGRSSVRWYIEDSESSSNDAETPEISDEIARQAAPSEDSAGAAGRKPQQSLRLIAAGDGGEELRYDDNTPLPDDFAEEAPEPATPRRRAEDRIEPRSPEFDEKQVDLALGDPGEWMELLGELGVERDPSAATPEGAAESTTEPAHPDTDAVTGNLPAYDADLADTDIRSYDSDDVAAQDAGNELPQDIDTQFDLQALKMGIDLTGNRDLQDERQPEFPAGGEEAPDEPDLAVDEGDAYDELEMAVDDSADELELVTDYDEDPETGPDRAAGLPADSASRSRAAGMPEETSSRDEAIDDCSADGEPAGDAGLPPAAVARDDDRDGDASSAVEPVVPSLTEEEMTINMLIDQDLMRFAEEQDVLASTAAGIRIPRDAPHVETIIMEGDLVRNALDDEDANAPGAAGAADDEPELPVDTFLEPRKSTDSERNWPQPPSWGAIAGVAVLGLLLLAQVVHAYRETLATNEVFERTIGTVYRLLGEPLVPDWDARSWQFQTTSGSTDETGEILTISSRIANQSGSALPYPLMYVSLTDRWEEPVGASVLPPTEYLASDADPHSQVAAGESFVAVVTIQSLSSDATGFKLNVCYPSATGQLRCATEDFKN